MKNDTLLHIAALRECMNKEQIAAFIVPSTDPHMGEYVAPRWRSRAWISGFTGSAGTAVITTQEAGLWTDSRYFLQAGMQLEGSGITLFKEGLPDTPTIVQWLAQVLPSGSTVAIEGGIYATSEALALECTLNKLGLKLRHDFAPFDEIWSDRPAVPSDTIYVHPENFSGASLQEKVAQVLQEAAKEGADSVLLTSLDDIAWTLNIRGTDVACNPVAVCFALLSKEGSTLFIDPVKITEEVAQYMVENQIKLVHYNQVESYVRNLSGLKLLADPKKSNIALFQAIPTESVIAAPSPVAQLKGVKNSVQIAGIRNAMQRDGVALVKFFNWLETHIDEGNVTEMDVSKMLTHFRSEQAYYTDNSFDTIAGYAEHGAIVHYSANAESNATLTRNSFLLIDSGGQYFDGTTDITRTIALGTPTDQQKGDFTRVLKGHIAIATCRYPEGTRGSQLDILARKALWDMGLTYLHGTGHGVGHFLNVHEGPQNIRLEENPTPLVPGMLTSNEPGLYRSGEYGIRLENLVLTVEDIETEFGRFYAFETLTLFPFDTKAIDKSLLNDEEVAWINNYHSRVFTTLSPSLEGEELAWLKRATAAI